MVVFDLEERIEEAVKAVIQAAGLPSGTTVIMAQEGTEISEPAVLISLPDSDIPEDERNIAGVTGNRQGLLTIGVRTHSDYGRTNHRALVALVRDLFYDDDLATTITAAATGAAVDRIEPQAAERSVTSGNSFITAIQAEVWFRPVVGD